MTETGAKKPDASIAGSGTLAGGVYGKVEVAGAASVQGDLEANTVSIAGSAKVNGSLKAETIGLAGSCSVKGDVEAGVFGSAGSITVEGNLKARSFEAAGSHRIDGGIKAETIEITGSLKAGGDVEAERFAAQGSFRVAGLVNADRIEIELDGARSTAREVGGSQIAIRSPQRGFFGLTRKGGHLEVESIEGDEINLEATEAQIVRGKRVEIGERCKIDTVEYSESLVVSPESSVKNQTKTTG